MALPCWQYGLNVDVDSQHKLEVLDVSSNFISSLSGLSHLRCQPLHAHRASSLGVWLMFYSMLCAVQIAKHVTCQPQ